MNIPGAKVNTMSGIKGLVGRKMTKTIKFMGEDVTISKLNVANVMEIQEKAKKLEENDNEGFDLLKSIILSCSLVSPFHSFSSILKTMSTGCLFWSKTNLSAMEKPMPVIIVLSWCREKRICCSFTIFE